MSSFCIWARVERMEGQRYRALAGAIPLASGRGPDCRDIRYRMCDTRSSAGTAAGVLAHEIGMQIVGRGDRIARVDVRAFPGGTAP